MIFTHQVMMFKLLLHPSNKYTRVCILHTTFALECVPFWSDLNHDSILSVVVNFQLYAPLLSLSQLNATTKFSQVFMLTQKLKPYSGFSF